MPTLLPDIVEKESHKATCWPNHALWMPHPSHRFLEATVRTLRRCHVDPALYFELDGEPDDRRRSSPEFMEKGSHRATFWPNRALRMPHPSRRYLEATVGMLRRCHVDLALNSEMDGEQDDRRRSSSDFTVKGSN